MAHEMLMLTALDASEELGARSDVELRDLLVDEIATLQRRSAERGIAWDIDAAEPVHARCYGYAIARALNALLRSTLERARDGSVLRIALRGDHRRAILTVEVTSTGIVPSDHADIRLAVARSVIDAHGGALSVRFHDDDVIRINLTIPCGAPPEQ